jgi:hypothetical protein
MRVIYTSKGMSKKFGVRVIYRKIRYIWNVSIYMAFVMADIKIFKLVLRLLPEDKHKRTYGWRIKILDSVMASAIYTYIHTDEIFNETH